MYSLCSGGGAQPIIEPKSIVVGVLSRNCVIVESTPTLTFWPKCSAIWVSVLSSEYGSGVVAPCNINTKIFVVRLSVMDVGVAVTNLRFVCTIDHVIRLPPLCMFDREQAI